MQWVQDPNQSNTDYLNNERCEDSRHCRNNKKEYRKATIDELETDSKIKNIRDWYSDISELKKGYWLRADIVKDEKGDLVAGCHSISARCRNHFSQLLNVNEVNDVRNTNSRTNSAPEYELAIEKLKRHKSPGTDQITAELIKAGGRTIHSEIHKLHNFMWKVSRNVPIYKMGDTQTAVIIHAYQFCQLRTKIYPTSCCQD